MEHVLLVIVPLVQICDLVIQKEGQDLQISLPDGNHKGRHTITVLLVLLQLLCEEFRHIISVVLHGDEEEAHNLGLVAFLLK